MPCLLFAEFAPCLLLVPFLVAAPFPETFGESDLNAEPDGAISPPLHGGRPKGMPCLLVAEFAPCLLLVPFLVAAPFPETFGESDLNAEPDGGMRSNPTRFLALFPDFAGAGVMSPPKPKRLP
jgi:hypothetical protein